MKPIREMEQVEDVEDNGLDDGRFFVHLKDGWDFGTDPFQVIRTKSFDSYRKAAQAVKKAKRT